MLRSFYRARRQRTYSDSLWRYEQLNEHSGRWTKRDVPGRKHVRALLGNHLLATIMALIGARALHGPTALHALLVRGRGSHTVGKLQEHQSPCRKHQE
jgi:hypothetical protein